MVPDTKPVIPVCMNVRTNNEDYIRRLRSKILRPAVEDSSTGRRIFDHNLRPNEDSSTAIFDPLFLEPSYRWANSFIFPNPKDAMTAVSDRSVEKFKDRFDLADLGFANDVCRYALGELFFLSFFLFDCLFIARIQRRLPSTRGIGGLDDPVW